MPRNRKKSS